jgi:hypothetical protein
MLVLAAAIVWFISRKYVRHHGDLTRAARNKQGEFTSDNEVTLDTLLGSDESDDDDPNHIPLDDTEADLSSADDAQQPFTDAPGEMKVVALATGPRKKPKK